MPISKKYDYTPDPNHPVTKVSLWIECDQEVLEVGCASGVHTRHLKEGLGCRVTGIEIDPLVAEDARPYCESLIIGSIEELDLAQALGDRLFDAITFVDVLEHLVDPTAVLKKVRPFLKAGGNLIASIPNIAHAAICWELAHGRFDYRAHGLLDDTHIHFFTKDNVARLFEAAGYQIVSWDRVIKTPEETEFGIYCHSAQERSFFDWICERNPEAHTYQFLVKAQLALDCPQESSHRELEARETLVRLEARRVMAESGTRNLIMRLDELKRRNVKLSSELDWLASHRFGALTGLIYRLLGKRRTRT